MSATQADKKEPIVHPHKVESITDQIGRAAQEMDFVGQTLARKICLSIQVLTAVSILCL